MEKGLDRKKDADGEFIEREAPDADGIIDVKRF
jgi:hypothetical protein